MKPTYQELQLELDRAETDVIQLSKELDTAEAELFRMNGIMTRIGDAVKDALT